MLIQVKKKKKRLKTLFFHNSTYYEHTSYILLG